MQSQKGGGKIITEYRQTGGDVDEIGTMEINGRDEWGWVLNILPCHPLMSLSVVDSYSSESWTISTTLKNLQTKLPLSQGLWVTRHLYCTGCCKIKHSSSQTIWPKWRSHSPNSVALSKAPVEAAGPWTRGQCITRCACLLPQLTLQYQITLLGDKTQMCVNNLPGMHSTAQRMEMSPRSPIARVTPNHNATEPHVTYKLIKLPSLNGWQ